MIINLVLGLILFFLCAVYTWSVYVEQKQKRVVLPKAEAGPISGAKNEPYDTKRFSFLDSFYLNGKSLNPSKYTKLIVEGICMKQRGIADGDIIFVRKFDKKFNKDKICVGDILLIWLDDERYTGYKIRVFKGYNPETNELETFYYNEDGSERFSSKCHRIDNIKGVVKYKIAS